MMKKESKYKCLCLGVYYIMLVSDYEYLNTEDDPWICEYCGGPVTECNGEGDRYEIQDL